MANKPYDNFILQNEVEDQFKSHLDLMTFVTVDESLVGNAGDLIKINRYKASDGTEKLTRGNGNTKSIEVDYTQKEYRVLLAQNRFEWFDEDEMQDPMIVPVGVRHAATDMFNSTNADIYAEFNKATLEVNNSTLGFDVFVDAVALLKLEDGEETGLFAFVSVNDRAKLRKALKDELKYVEAYARNGYIGTVAGINIYTKKDAVDGTIIVATKEAVKFFVKKGSEVELSERNTRSAEDANIRKNTAFLRKIYLPALVREDRAVKITIA